MNAIQSALQDTIYVNNGSARRIISSKLQNMSKYPSETKAQELEEMGLSVDYKAGDEGMEMERHNFDK